MKRIVLVLAMVFGLAAAASAQAPKVYDESIDAMKQIKEAI